MVQHLESEYRFESEEWARRTPSECIYRCYVMAEEAQRLGAMASPRLARAYRELAAHWKKLAREIAFSEASDTVR